MKQKELQNKIDDLVNIAMQVSAIIKVIADSCEHDDLIDLELTLRIAQEKQKKLLDNIIEMSINTYA